MRRAEAKPLVLRQSFFDGRHMDIEHDAPKDMALPTRINVSKSRGFVSTRSEFSKVSISSRRNHQSRVRGNGEASPGVKYIKGYSV